MKSWVLAIRACSSSKVLSVSSQLGTSTSARRAAQPLAMSLAICTWRTRGNMSGARRDSMNTLGSMPRAWALASAFLRMLDRLPSMRARTGTDASYMDKDMVIAPFRVDGSAQV
ncbi:hypothetical protein D9M73_195050 [compost metagenome]